MLGSSKPLDQSATDLSMNGEQPVHDGALDDLLIVDPQLKEKYEHEQAAPAEEVVAAPELPPAVVSVREKSRVLFLSYEDDIFEEGSATQGLYATYGSFFEEVHVIVFTEATHSFSGLQIAENVWAYPTNTTAWWKYPYDAFLLAREQLYFAKFFRADVVVARDPFELAGAAYCISRWFRTPLVVYNNSHVYDPHFLDEQDNNSYRVWWAHQVISRADHVCVTTERLKRTMLARHELAEAAVSVVPPYAELSAPEQQLDRNLIHSLHPSFTFTLLVVAPLANDTRVTFVINAVQYTLRQYRSIGLFIIGDGPQRAMLEALVKSKGLEQQVIFLGDVPPAPYMASAGMLMELTDDEEADSVLLQAVSLELPVITTAGATLGGILEHDASALICKSGDLGCAIQSIAHYMNNSTERLRFAKEAKSRLLAKGTSRTASIEQLVLVLAGVVSRYRGIPAAAPPTPTEEGKQDTL